MTRADSSSSAGGSTGGRRERRRPRLLFEGLTIVGSILLAFAVDAWWDASRERRDARELVAVLSEELEGTRSHLDAVVAAASGRVGTIRASLVDPDSLLSIPIDEVVGVIVQLMAPMTFDPSRGALTAILTGGALEKLDDADLRSAISSLPGALDDIDEEGDFLVENMHLLQGRMAELGITSRIFLTISGDLPPEGARDLLRQLITDPQMREHLAEAAITSGVLLDEIDGLRELIVGLGEQVDSYR